MSGLVQIGKFTIENRISGTVQITVTDQFDSNYMKLHMHAKEKQKSEYGHSKQVAKRLYGYKESGKCEMEAFFHSIKK